MYSVLPSFVLGFHGCDREVGEAILAGSTTPNPSENDYDWLGNGVYFWENSPHRAYSYAQTLCTKTKQTKGSIKNPFVIGAIIDPGYCLNLTEENALFQVRAAYRELQDIFDLLGESLPQNKPGYAGDTDCIKRYLDCAVIEVLHTARRRGKLKPYDTVRSPFFEGNALYPGTSFTEKAHVQLAVRNLECIKGYFRPLNKEGILMFP